MTVVQGEGGDDRRYFLAIEDGSLASACASRASNRDEHDGRPPPGPRELAVVMQHGVVERPSMAALA
jgi:hypothetical protein